MIKPIIMIMIGCVATFVGIIFIFYGIYLNIEERKVEYRKHRDNIIFFVSLMDELAMDREETYNFLMSIRTPRELIDVNKKLAKALKKHK